MASRFYSSVSVEAAGGSWRILLDGRPVKTPQRAEFTLPSESLAQAIAEEWEAQSSEIDPAAMPLTKLANTAIDGVTGRETEIGEDILRFAARDLLCYRADQPQELEERQREVWDPLIHWVNEHYGARLCLAAGVMPIDQPAEAIASLRTAIICRDAFALTALHVMTSLTGSAVLPLARICGRLTLDEAWEAAHLDEDFQIARWGEDAEAKARRAARYKEMAAASKFYALAEGTHSN